MVTAPPGKSAPPVVIMSLPELNLKDPAAASILCSTSASPSSFEPLTLNSPPLVIMSALLSITTLP